MARALFGPTAATAATAAAAVACLASIGAAGAGSVPRQPVVGDGGMQLLTTDAGVVWRASGVAPNGTAVSAPATVPGQIQLDLETAGIIDNTYARDNVAVNSWVAATDWRFSANFTLDAPVAAALASGSQVWLVLDGVDTLGTVYLNEDVPPPVVPGSLDKCFVEQPHTLPVPREGYATYLPSDHRPACEAACVADAECKGFTMADPSGPTSAGCWIYHNVSALSNGTGFRDGDWYGRAGATDPDCQAPAPPTSGARKVNDQFLRYAFPVARQLKAAGPNAITVALKSVAPFGHGCCGVWTAVRKAPSNFGYDWSPGLETQGVWLPLYLVVQQRVMLADMVATVVATPSSNPLAPLDPATAAFNLTVTVRLNMTAAGVVAYTVSGNFTSGAAVSRRISLPAGVSTVTDTVLVKGVELWWPAGYGAQPLYTVEATAQVVSDGAAGGPVPLSRTGASASVSAARKVGFRSVAMESTFANATTPQRHIYRVNGVPIYAKGANWVPPDSLQARATDELVCTELKTSVAANMNFFRIWGGGLYERDALYDCADEHGVLLHQDAIFSDAVYPYDPAFLSLISAEISYQARRLASHPSLFLWSGSNELPPSGPSWDAVFLETLFPNLTAVDRSRPVWPACPAWPWSAGVDAGGLPNGEPFQVSRTTESFPPGEAHQYFFNWCSSLDNCGSCAEDSLYATTSFASEFGWIGMPSLESLAPVLGPPSSGDYRMLSSGVAVRQNSIMHQDKVANLVQWTFGPWVTPFLNVSEPRAFRRVIHQSQMAQSGCLRAEAEHYRRARDTPTKTGGSLFWMLNDNWPAPSWTSLEYGGRQKLLHFEAARFYAPVAVSSYCTPSTEACTAVALHVSSDSSASVAGATLSVSAVRWADGAQGQPAAVLANVTVLPFGGLPATLDAAGLAGVLKGAGCANNTDCFLVIRLTDASGALLAPQTQQWLSLWRDARLVPNAELTVTAKPADGGSAGQVSVTVTSSAVSPVVMVHCASPSDFGTFDDNGLLLLPGKPATVVFTPRSGPSGATPFSPCSSSEDFYAVGVNGLGGGA